METILILSLLYLVYKSYAPKSQGEVIAEKTFKGSLEPVGLTAKQALLWKIYKKYPELKTLHSGKVVQGIPLPAAYFWSIIAVESSGDADCSGKAGERGLMQITGGALDDVNKYYSGIWTLDDLWTPINNATVGILYWNLCYNQLKTIAGATRAYNAGPTGAKNERGYEYLAKVEAFVSEYQLMNFENRTA
jgi:hypothetical protein